MRSDKQKESPRDESRVENLYPEGSPPSRDKNQVWVFLYLLSPQGYLGD